MYPVQKSNPADSITKTKYLRNMLNAFQQFQYTRSPEVLKLYMKKNRELLASCIEAIPQIRNEAQPLTYCEDLQSPVGPSQFEKEVNGKLQQQYLEELEISRGNGLRISQIRAVDQNREMDSTLMSLNKQLQKLQEEYERNVGKLEKKRFYREWNLMSKEYDGAKSINGRLRAQLEKKKNQIKSLSQ